MLENPKSPGKPEFNSTKLPNYQYLEVNRINYKSILFKSEFSLNIIKINSKIKK